MRDTRVLLQAVCSRATKHWTSRSVSRDKCVLGEHLTTFFFSSRRRHTRFDCDWSSDVCSSDLNSFYFTNNPFFKNKMVFYNTGSNGKQIYTVDMKSKAVEQVTHQRASMSGELVEIGRASCRERV